MTNYNHWFIRARLKTRQLLLLVALAEAWPRTVTRSELHQQLWHDEPPESDALRSHLYTLRQALGEDQALVKTVHGVGLRLDLPA